MTIEPPTQPHPLVLSRRSSLVKVGGAMGVAASFIAMAIFFGALFGFSAVFMLSILPIAMGAIGLVMAIVGAICHQPTGEDETQPISAMFVCFTGLLIGLIEWTLWR